MQPRQMRDTFTPVEPRLTYSIAHQVRAERRTVKPRNGRISNSHCGQGPAETGGFCASDLQTGLISWLESGLGVALVWLWCGFGVALVWLWCGFGVALVWLWCGFDMALVWLWGSSVLRSLCLVPCIIHNCGYRRFNLMRAS